MPPRAAAAIAHHPTSHVHPFALWACLACLAGCGVNEAECLKARQAAQQAWQAYEQTLAPRKTLTEKLRNDAVVELRRQQQAVSRKAFDETSRLYDSGPAWQRHYESALVKACHDDPKCSEAEKTKLRVDAEFEGLERRSTTVAAAQLNALNDARAAWSAALAVEPEPDRPAYVTANEAALASAKACGVSITEGQ